MAKKLVYNSTFTPGAAGAGTIAILGNFPLKVFQLITNVTDGIIIYNFADPTNGGSVTYDASINTTTLTLEHDTSAMSASDEIQIFIDKQEQKVDFSETFTDPVSKLRVSNPQNLIDTDFEYGLQPTKWETVELVNNIPSFFASNTTYSIADVVSVTTIEGSDNITVTSLYPHGLTVGAPFDIQGLTSRTAEGKFLVTSLISDTVFVYKAKNIQDRSGIINGSYTVITPGEFYSGSDIQFSPVGGIETDGNLRSSVKIETDYHHGFGRGSSLYFTNTIGTKKFTISQTSTDTAPDGRPYVDFEDTQTTSVSTTPSLTETKNMTGTYAYKFTGSSVNTTDNTITWNDNGLAAGDVLLYVPPSGDTHIGGLERFQIYYVKSASTNTITLCSTSGGNYGGNSTINLSSTGTSNYGRHQLILGYEIRYAEKPYRAYDVRFRTRYNQFNSGSGQDMTSYVRDSSTGRYGYFGLSNSFPERFLFVSKTGKNPNNGIINNNIPLYSTARNSNFTFGKSGTVPDGYDFIEDFQKFNSNSSYYNYGTGNNFTSHYYQSRNSTYSIQIYYIGWFNYWSSYTESYSPEELFVFFLKNDPERDTIYSEAHGFTQSTTATVTTNSGSNISRRTDTGQTMYTTASFQDISSGSTVNLQVVSEDRLRVSPRIRSATGTYTIAGQIASPTKNSFYFAGHDLVEHQPLQFATTGAVPGTTSGAINPDNNSIKQVRDGVNGALNTLVSDMGSDHVDLFFQNSNPAYLATLSSTQIENGRHYFYWYNSRANFYSDATGWVYSPYYYSNSSIQNQLRQAEPFDPFADTSIGGQGFMYTSTPHTGSNTNTPFFMEIMQAANPNNVGSNRCYYYMNGWKYHYQINGTYGNVSTLNTSLGSGWEYNYRYNYFSPQDTSGYHGLLAYSIYITNTNWTGYYSTTPNFYFYGNRYMYGPDSRYRGTSYLITFIVPVKTGTTASRYGVSGSFRDHATIVNNVATSIKTQLTAPSLGQGLVYAKPLNANRFSLQTVTKQEYDLTSSGTSPFSFTTEELTGTLDGYYSVDTVSPTTIGNFSRFELPKRQIGVGNTEIVTLGGTVYFHKPNYKMKTSQKLTYEEIGGNPAHGIPGLSTTTTYYAIADGPDHFRVADSVVNANSGNAVSIATTSAGSFRITTPSVAGVSAGSGTCGLSSETAVVTGTDSLFKRFFSPGDDFRYKDNSTTPPSYRTLPIASVIDDDELTLVTSPGVEETSTNYYIETKVNTRPDGAFLHRPFDGGVEIDAGTSPNSSIVRQTRKYFRYQSGKGIQCSVAINFNPSRLVNKLVSVNNAVLPAQEYTVNFNNNEASTYNVSGDDRDGRVLGENETITITKGDTLILEVNAIGHPLYVKTQNTTGAGNAVSTGITNNGTQNGTITWDTTSVSSGTYYYNCSNHSSMFGRIIVEATPAATTIVTGTTKYPHGLTRTSAVKIKGATDNAFNGTFNVRAFTEFTFSYYLTAPPTSSIPDGIISYNIDGWANSAVRCGLFDYQNGMFYEFDGQDLYTVRRSSVQQLTGTVNVTAGSNILSGTDTNFSGQLAVGGRVVIRGGSYKITHIPDKTTMHVQPAYKGVSASGVVATKTEDIRVPQSQWNIDKADGTGPSGFVLDLTKIQMAYMDYSWYGAGKIRFGFKDANGHVKYMNEFLHNNVIEEAYMRSGNMPGRYEIENTSDTLPTYVPSLFHWGTSVIMDGKFDDDKAYLFTAASNTLSFSNGDVQEANPSGNSALVAYYRNRNERDYYVRIPFNASSHGSKFSTGVPLYTSNGQLNGETVAYSYYSGNDIQILIYLGRYNYRNPPAIYPQVTSSDTVGIGGQAGVEQVDLRNLLPLISIRLAPSVDNNLTGALGQREIVNRMQLQLKQMGITITHDCNVDLILNGGISNRTFTTVNPPSLSQLVTHKAGDKIIGGTNIFSLRASGGQENAAGTKRLSATSDFDISQIIDLGNSILGGDGTFPNGPDILTIALRAIDTSEISGVTPLKVSGRITWTESQA